MRDDQRMPLSRWDAERVVELGWRSQRKCCPDAVIVPCVCRVSVSCPTHGLICAGSHD
jgi:hypothetical protein